MYLDDFIKRNPNIPIDKLSKYVDKYSKQFMRGMSIPSTAWARSWTPTNTPELMKYRGITFNKKQGNNITSILDSLKKTADSKFHPVGCDTVKSIIDHELGHQLDNLPGIRKLQHIKDLRNNTKLNELTEKLSKYSWDNGNGDRYAEMIAEGWAEYVNNPNPREYAKIIGETIESEYKKLFGGGK